MGSAAEQLEAAVLRSIRNATQSEGSLRDDILGFYHAVDWSERWLSVLAAFIVLLGVISVCTRRHSEVQMALLIFVLCLVYSAEWLNRLGSTHWRSFATQNYFDERGVFISVLFSAPLLVIAFGLLINALRTTARLLIDVKKLQFQKEKKARDRRDKALAEATAAAAAKGESTAAERKKER